MTCTVLKNRETPAAYAATFSVANRAYALQDANFNVTALVTRFTLIGDGTQDAGQWDQVGQDVWVWTEGTGWYENRHRIYSATMARFGQQDPMGYVDGANLYLGFGTDPTNSQDPFGLRITNWRGVFNAPERAAIEDADRATNRNVTGILALLRRFAPDTWLDSEGRVERPNSRYFVMGVLWRLQRMAQRILDELRVGVTIDKCTPAATAANPDCHATQRSRVIAIYPLFYSAPNESYIHEMAHMSFLAVDDEDMPEQAAAAANSLLAVDVQVNQMLNDAYWWEKWTIRDKDAELGRLLMLYFRMPNDPSIR